MIHIFRKGLVFTIIGLFIGAGVVQSIGINLEKTHNEYTINNNENEKIEFSSNSVSYDSLSPGLIIAIGQGTWDDNTHEFEFDLGIFAFLGYSGGGPSFIHTYPMYAKTKGWYSFLGPTLKYFTSPLVFVVGVLWPNASTPPYGGSIIGASYGTNVLLVTTSLLQKTQNFDAFYG